MLYIIVFILYYFYFMKMNYYWTLRVFVCCLSLNFGIAQSTIQPTYLKFDITKLLS